MAIFYLNNLKFMNSMRNGNFIGIRENEIDKPIYRIFPIGRLIQMLTTNQLTLVKPEKWDDPFENALLSSVFKFGLEDCKIPAKDSIYGQCWTLHRETDAMWRIYSQNKDGVKLMTTPRKLLKSLSDFIGAKSNTQCFIGKVSYKNKTNMIESFSKIDLLDASNLGAAESILYKRPQFSHEKEVRLIYIGDNDKCHSDIFDYQINPNELFDRVIFDPRMEESLISSYAKAIAKLGLGAEVKRSTLYDAPKDLKFKINIYSLSKNTNVAD